MAIYADNLIRAWDVRSQKRVFYDTLLPEPLGKMLAAKRLKIGPNISHVQGHGLAVQFEPSGHLDAPKMPPQVGIYSRCQLI